MMIHYPALPSPVQTRLPYPPYLPHPMSTKTSRLCHRLITHSTHTPPIGLLTASNFPLPHETLPTLAQYNILSPQVSTPLRKPPRLLLVPLPPHQIPFFSRVKRTSWCLPIHQTSHHQHLV